MLVVLPHTSSWHYLLRLLIGALLYVVTVSAVPAKPVANPVIVSISSATTPAQPNKKRAKKTIRSATPIKPTKSQNYTENKPSKPNKESKETRTSSGFLHIVPAKIANTRVQSLLNQAFAALQAGQHREAQQYYEQVLQYAKDHSDALLGLANIALHEERPETARILYQRIFAQDPFDPDALAGLVLLDGERDLQVNESRLKTALNTYPDAPALYVVLGNLYARQKRWAEAQHAYFNAYSLAPGNPEYAFNLAVSLEHLRQYAQAAHYYQDALAKSTGQNEQFNPQQIRQRVNMLTARQRGY